MNLMLGTVQLGLPYGIANRSGQPTYTEARNIVACAYAGGVRGLDTAAAYGESEARLGRILHDMRLKDMLVVSKTLPGEDPVRSVQESLRRLRLAHLAVCLCHREADWFRDAQALLQLKEQGVVGRVGVSVTTPAGARAVVAGGQADVLQVPANLLDRRFVPQPVPVFVRSVFLQGLLLLPEAEVPAALRQVLPVRQVLARLAQEAGLALAELALRYALGLGAVGVLVGVETVEQMAQNLAWAHQGPLPVELQRQVVQSVPDLPDRVLAPQLWQT